MKSGILRGAIVIIIIGFVLAACGGAPAATPTPEATPTSELSEQELISQGEQVYSTNCASCHQPAGEGIEGTFPALAGNTFVTAENPSGVIQVVLQGREQMPAFGDQLSNQEIAAVISYIRNSFGNDASIVTPSQVEAAR